MPHYFAPNDMNCVRAATHSTVDCYGAKGFTQAELMVAILVMGILAAIAAPNLSQWLRQKQVDAAFNQIEFALQETQTEAVKRHRACYLNLPRGDDPTLTGNCLVTGDRFLQNITLNYLPTRPSNSWKISFNENGENRSVSNSPGTLWLTSIDGSVQSKCLVISVGIGLRRSGKYENNTCITP
jgi:prepilin-type N-terminal cleavage/methylation domain-containing protein